MTQPKSFGDKLRRKGIEWTTGVVIAAGAVAMSGCAVEARPPATGSAIPGEATPGGPSPSEGKPIETPGGIVVTSETPKDQIDPLTAKEALGIPDELEADVLAEASRKKDGVYDVFRQFMTLEDVANMSDEKFAQEAFNKITHAKNAFYAMHKSAKWGDENGNNSITNVIQQCTDARNGLYGFSKNSTSGKDFKDACHQRYDKDQADMLWDKPDPVYGPRPKNPKPYKEGLVPSDDIKVISRSGNTVVFTGTQRAVRIVNNEVLRNAGLVGMSDTDNIQDTDTKVTITYAVTDNEGQLSVAIVSDKQ